MPRSSGRFSHFLPSSLSVLPLGIVVVVVKTMSGKAPPTGPRALLGSLQQHQQYQTASSSSQPLNPPLPPQPQTPQSSPITLSATPVKRIGAVPPTGPRSLTNGRQPPPCPKQLLNGRTSPTNSSLTMSTGPHALQSNRHPISIKGKIPDKPAGVRQISAVRICLQSYYLCSDLHVAFLS